MRYAALLLLALWGCKDDDDKEFPASVGNASYSNGHALALNEVDTADDQWEAELVTLTNELRVQSGLSPLTRNLTLDAVGRAHSLHMYEHFFFDHNNPEGEHAAARLNHFASGVSWVVRENIWIVEPGRTPQYVLDGFLASPSHRDAILSHAHLIGVGMVRRPYNSVPDHIYVSMEFLELR